MRLLLPADISHRHIYEGETDVLLLAMDLHFFARFLYNGLKDLNLLLTY